MASVGRMSPRSSRMRVSNRETSEALIVSTVIACTSSLPEDGHATADPPRHWLCHLYLAG